MSGGHTSGCDRERQPVRRAPGPAGQEFTRTRRDEPTQPVDVSEAVRAAAAMTRARWRDDAQSRGVEIRLGLGQAGWGVEVRADEVRALTKPFRFDDVQDVVASVRGTGGPHAGEGRDP